MSAPAPSWQLVGMGPAESVPFWMVCECFTAMVSKSSASKKLKLFFTESLSKRIGRTSMFPLLRLLLPGEDRSRSMYNIKTKTLIKLYVKAMGIEARNNPYKDRLERWKDPSAANEISKVVGSFPEVLRDVLRARGHGSTQSQPGYQHITVGRVNELLDTLANDSSRHIAVISELLRECSAEQHMWLARIIIKDMHLGVSANTVFQYFHPDALSAFNNHQDLRRLCGELHDRSVRLAQRVCLFDICRPMLAKRMSIANALDNMKDFAIELKLDGERMLVHMDRDRDPAQGPRVECYTRNGINYTDLYGPSLEDLVVENVRCRRCILDGEVIAFDRTEGRWMEFGHNREVAKRAVAAKSYHMHGGLRLAAGLDSAGRDRDQNSNGNNGRTGRTGNEDDDLSDVPAYLRDLNQYLVYVVFDIIYMDCPEDTALTLDPELQCSLTQLPWDKRRAILSQVVNEVPQWLMVEASRRVTTTDKLKRREIILEELDQAIMDRSEGLVVKNVSAPYAVGERSLSWVKIKPDYMHGLGDELDVIILAGYYSEGKRRAGISHFLLGVRRDDPGARRGGGGGGAKGKGMGKDRPPEYFTISKVGSGYAQSDLSKIRSKLEPHWRKYDPKKRPAHFKTWVPSKGKDVPAVWVPPEESIILSLTGAQITTSEQFSSNLTVRFPRVKEVRFDKSWEECMTFSELSDLVAKQHGGIHGNGLNIDRLLQDGEGHLGAGAGLGMGMGASTSLAGAAGLGMSSSLGLGLGLGGRVRRAAGQRKGLGAKQGVMNHFKPFTAKLSSLDNDGNSQLDNQVFEGLEIHVIAPGSNKRVLLDSDSDSESDSEMTVNFASASAPSSPQTTTATKTTKKMRMARKGKAPPQLQVKLGGRIFAATDKHSVEEIVVNFGGRVAGECNRTTDIVVALNPSGLKFANFVKSGSRDIMTVQYLLDSARAGRCLSPPMFKHYMFMSSQTKEDLRHELDEFGDHFTSFANNRTFATLMANVSEAKRLDDQNRFDAEPSALQWGALLDDEEDPLATKSTPFRGAVAYFDRYQRVLGSAVESRSERRSGDDESELVDRYSMLEVQLLVFRLHGGRVVGTLGPDVTHVIIDEELHNNEERLAEIKRLLMRLSGSRMIVKGGWVQEVVDSRLSAWDADKALWEAYRVADVVGLAPC